MELFKLLGTIAVDSSEAKKALDDVSSKGGQAESKLSKAFGAMGKGAVAVGKTTVKGLAVGGAAMGTLTVKSMNLAGELEQNMGGSEAVFKEHATTMQNTAKEAYSNMGLSTSDYLATANKMGALFQGAGFSVKESMTLSSDAMQRAADVASIMGLDTSAAMEAVAGAAKGNFTMMDNLGVAMNDTTLNAYALEKGIGKTTQEMTNQEKIGLAMELFMEKTAYAADNYAKENETLAGSLGTAKAALTNFLDGSGDVESLVSSFGNLANVVVKNLGEITPRLITGITDIVNQIMPMLPPLLQQILPTLIQGATSLINGLVAAMPTIINAIMGALPAVIQGVTQIINALIKALPQIMQAIVQALPTLIPLLVEALVSLIVTLCTMLPEIIQPIIDNLPMIIVTLVNALLENLPALIEGAIQLVAGLVAAFPQILVALWEAIKGIFTQLTQKLTGFFEPVKNAISNAWQAMGNVPGLAQLKTMIENVWNTIMTHIKTVMGVIKDVVSTLWNAIKDNVGAVIEVIKTLISSSWETIKTIISNVMKLIASILKGDWEGVKNAISNIINAIKTHISKVWDSIKNFISTVLNSIKSVVSSVWNGIKTVISSAINTVKTNISNVFNGIKNTISNVFNGIKTTAQKAWNEVKTKMTEPVEKAKEKIDGIVQKLKKVFDFKWSLPELKLPHISVSGGEAPYGIGGKGKLPSFAIEWYQKAMKNPMVLNDPTIFGFNPATGAFMGGGEAGEEVVAGASSLMQMIKGAVNSEINGVAYYLQQLIAMLADYFPELIASAGHDVVLNDGALVGRLAPAIDVELGKISQMKGRGR